MKYWILCKTAISLQLWKPHYRRYKCHPTSTEPTLISPAQICRDQTQNFISTRNLVCAYTMNKSLLDINIQEQIAIETYRKYCLTHLPLHKMATISQTIISDAFLSMKIFEKFCNRESASASSYGLGWYKYAIATQWYQLHTTVKCGFLFMPWITGQ